MADQQAVGAFFCGLSVQAAGLGSQRLLRLTALAAKPGPMGPGKRSRHGGVAGGV